MGRELIVTPVPGARNRFSDPDPLLEALVDLAHRKACEAAQMHQLQHPKSVEFMEAETGRKGWRAYMSAETALAVREIEDRMAWRFIHVDDAPPGWDDA